MTEQQLANLRESLQKETLKEIEFGLVLEKVAKYSTSILGKEIILNSQPVKDIDWLRNEVEAVDQMLRLISTDNDLPLDSPEDIRNHLSKSMIAGAALSPNDLLMIRDSIRTGRLIKQYFNLHREQYPLLAKIADRLHENRLLEKHIESAIDDTGAVRDNATRELADIRRKIIESSSTLRNRIQKILKRTSQEDLLQDDFVSMREGRFVIPMKVENKRALPGIIHGVSQTGSTVFLEPSEIIDLNNELSLLHNAEQREVYKILSSLTAEVGSEAREFLATTDVIAHFDALFAKAKYAFNFGGMKPEIVDYNILEARKLYHPLLLHKYGSKKVIPLTVKFDEVKRGFLISGPNAGGKTVALKSIALNLAMSMTGIFPLGEFTANPRSIYSSIGDHQSIENDLSTFSSQISKLRDILLCSDENAYVAVDEICSGTDPQEGSALACSILDSFIGDNLFFMVTTHQSSLKTYALNRPSIENASLEFDDEKLMPTYHFLSGSPGNSYAFHLAKSVGLPAKVLKNAYTYLSDKERELEESIAILSKYRNEAVKTLSEAKKIRFDANQVKAEYEVKFADLKQNKKVLLDKARQEATEVLQSANKLIENTIREIREDKKAPGEIKREFEAEKSKITKSVAKKSEAENLENESKDLKVGDYVAMDDSGSVGNVVELYDDNKNALIEIGGIKLKIKSKLLKKVKQAPKKEYARGSSAEYIKFDSGSRLDMRGMRADECLRALEEFISSAILGNLSMATIVHGKGTGALRETVQQYLKSVPSVKRFRIGELVEGGAGVTIVEF